MRLLFTLLFLSAATLCRAVAVTGASPAIYQTTNTYMYSGSTLVSPTWHISYGTAGTSWQSGGNYYIQVTWSTMTNLAAVTMNDGATFKATLNVVIAPVVPATSSLTRCNSGTLSLPSTAGAGGTTVKWYAAATGGTALATGSPFTTPTISATTVYYVSTYNSTYSAESTTRAAVTATVGNTPTVAPTVSGTVRFGPGTLTLTGTGANGNYDWYNASNVLQYTGMIFTTAVITASATNYYYAKAVSAAICEGPLTWISVTVYPAPVISGDSYISLGTATVSGQTGYDQYIWKDHLNNVVFTSTTTNIFTTSVPDSYTLTVVKGGFTSLPTAAFSIANQFDGQNENMVIANSVLVDNTLNATDVNALPITSRSQTIQYFDGLGRPKQSVVTKGSPFQKDIIQPVVYDEFGRESVKYLPYESTTNNGWFAVNAITNQSSFYTTADKVAHDINPYAKTILETGEINRVLQEGMPGQTWQPVTTSTYASPDAADHTVLHNYDVDSTGTVLLWTYTAPDASNPFGKVNAGSAGATTTYAAMVLWKKLRKDEHHKETIDFSDKDGHVILKKVQLNGSYAQTYYIYDIYGNLVCVIPPQAVANLATQYFQSGATDATKSAFLDLWAFRYRYDTRNRMIMKKVPGAGPVYMVYDNRDRLVLTQDDNQRRDAAGNLTRKQWTFTKYDNLNRPVMTGIYTHSAVIDQAAMTALISTTNFFETYNGVSATYGYTTSAVFPTTGLSVNSVTYYDNYAFKSMITGTAYDYLNTELTGQETAANVVVRNHSTGSLTRILGSATMLWDVNYYDAKYRMIQSVSDHQHGTLRHTSVYDFAGRVTSSFQNYTVNSVSTKIKETIAYDHASRVISKVHSLNGATGVMLFKNQYNSLGQVIDKGLHSTDNGATFKQSLDYRYTIRGWLSSVNNSLLVPDGGVTNDDTNDLFGFNIGYNENVGIGNLAMYNGNISAIRWSHFLATGKVTDLTYRYLYDDMNRYIRGNVLERKSDGGWDDSNKFMEGFVNTASPPISYDLNGNITTMLRTNYGGGPKDYLTYTYNGNQLQKVSDAWDPADGFIDGTNTGNDYTYDANGNMNSDANKSIDSISYNILNLPVRVSKHTGEYLKYYYTASGTKLYQEVYSTTGVLQKTTDYIGGLVFEKITTGSSVLQFVQHDEGRVVMTGSSPEYQYHLKDHLGNVRLTFSTVTINNSATATFESAAQASEATTLTNYPTATNLVMNTTFAHTGSYSTRLTGASGSQVGVAKSFKVMPGDILTISAYGKYSAPTATTSNLSGFAMALINAFGYTAAPGGAEGNTERRGLYDYGTSEAAGHKDGSSDTADPLAFVTILLFDDQYVFLDVAYAQLTSANQMIATYTARQVGYAYLYISNEQSYQTDVYFDDVSISLTQGSVNIVQSDDYYPFGSMFNSYQRENTLKNKRLYNAGSELQDDLGMDVSETDYRMLDSKIGRWWQVDPKPDHGGQESLAPYNYAFNNPILHNDPKGDCPPGVDCGALIAAAGADAAANPNGIGAHGLGITQGLASSAEGLANAVSHPVQTLGGLGNLALAGVAGNPANAMQMDAALGTNSLGAMVGVANAVTTGANNLISGNGIQRGTTIGQIGGAIIGSKGMSAGFGALRSTVSGAEIGSKLFLSANFGITSAKFGSSLVKAGGTFNQTGGLFKAGWSNVARNGGGMQFRIGIGTKATNSNQALFHFYVPKTFVPNRFANPSMQLKLSLYKMSLRP